MSHRTVRLSSFEEYLASEDDSLQVRAFEEQERELRRSRFPHTVTLQLSFAELDYANRWCWQHFGPADGNCLQYHSDYPVCDLAGAHSHKGKWIWYWLVKTEYNFGFCEWCFFELSDQNRFLASVSEIHWGEKYT